MSESEKVLQLQKEIEQLRLRLHRTVLENAIHNETDAPASMEELSQHLLCQFHSDYLILAIIHAQADPLRRHTSPAAPHLRPIGDTPFSSEGAVYYASDALACAESLCKQHLLPKTQAFVFRADRDIGILLNPVKSYVSDASISCGNYLTELKTSFKEIAQDLNEALSFGNTVSISAIHQGTIRMRDMYVEASHTYDYSWNIPDIVNTYSDLCTSPMTTKEQVELSSLEREFISDAERLLFFEASVVLDNILRLQFLHAVPLQQISISVTARLRHVLAIAELAADIHREDIVQLDTLLHKVSAAVSVPELLDRIHDFFVELSEVNPREKQDKGTLILEFIEANSRNPALNAQIICDRFRISPTYLSRLIRKATGKGLVDCIHFYRIKEAKTLLEETQLSVEAISLQVGFSNRYSLIRAFRALENTTPSEYRSKPK